MVTKVRSTSTSTKSQVTSHFKLTSDVGDSHLPDRGGGGLVCEKSNDGNPFEDGRWGRVVGRVGAGG